MRGSINGIHLSAILAVAAMSANPAYSQSAGTVVATDENMGIQAVPLGGWDMSTFYYSSATMRWESSWDGYPAPNFACGKAVSFATIIRSDLSTPSLQLFKRTNYWKQFKLDYGGVETARCFTGNPSYTHIHLELRRPGSVTEPEPSQSPYFKTYAGFSSTSAQRGWILMEYFN